MRLAGKIGIVTAAASGMGRAGALRFAREGAQVAVVDVDAAGVKRVVGEITAAGGTAHGIAADLTKDEDSRRIVWETVSRFKGLDFVWNHVGHPRTGRGRGHRHGRVRPRHRSEPAHGADHDRGGHPGDARARRRQPAVHRLHVGPAGLGVQPGVLDVQVRRGGLREEPGACAWPPRRSA